MRAVLPLLVLLACRAEAGFPGCPECDEASARVSRLGASAAAAALLGKDGFYAEERLVELGVPAVTALLTQFSGRRCTEPRGAEASFTQAQQDALSSARECERLTAKALARVLCDRALPPGVVVQVSKRLDARLASWLPLSDCTGEVLDALAPRLMAVVGGERDRAPLLETLVPLRARALAALPWAMAALGEGDASRVPALHLLGALGRSAKEAWPSVAGLARSPNARVAEAALGAAVHLGDREQFEPLLMEAITGGIAQGCTPLTFELLRAWPRGGGPRLGDAAAQVLRACPGVEAAAVLREVPGAGRRHLAALVAVLNDEKRPIRERALLAEALMDEAWEPPLELAAADEVHATRLLTKARVERPTFAAQQLPPSVPSPWLELGDVDVCRAEVGLGPLDAGWPVEGANLTAVSAAMACLRERWCGPDRATFRKALATCCAAFDASVPSWCIPP